MSRRDAHTPDLFEVPLAPAPLAASMDHRAAIAHLLADMLATAHAAGLDRYEVAARASRLAAKDVSKYMLDAYTAESREEFNLPLWLLPALEAACGSHRLTSWLCAIRGGRLYVGEDALAAELGRIERQRDALHEQATTIKRRLKGSA